MGTFKLGELFCGPGGIAYGALQAKSNDGAFKIEHTWANDYDADTCETYRKNICPDAPETVYCSDVRDLDIKNLKKLTRSVTDFPVTVSQMWASIEDLKTKSLDNCIGMALRF